MTHYIEFHIEQDRITPQQRQVKTAQIMSSLISILHRVICLYKEGEDCLALSFPFYSEKNQFLGNIIRLHGDKEILSEVFSPKVIAKILNDNKELRSWLIDAEYLNVSSVLKVPSKIKGHAIFTRQRTQANLEQLRRRRMKRHNETYEQASKIIYECRRSLPRLPKVYIHSHSTKQLFPLVISRKNVDGSRLGRFNSYGLSMDRATVPIF